MKGKKKSRSFPQCLLRGKNKHLENYKKSKETWQARMEKEVNIA